MAHHATLPGETPAPRRSRLARRAILLGLIFSALFAAWIMADVWLPAVARFLNVGERPEKADYLLVLGGGIDTRPFAAAALYRAGVAPRVILTQPVDSGPMLDGLVPSNLEVFRRVLLAGGVAEQDLIVLPGEAASTFDEARALAAYLAEEPTASVVVVTNNFHTRRARWILRRENPVARIRMVAVPMELYDESNWYHALEGWTTYLNEYVKFAWYRLRYL